MAAFIELGARPFQMLGYTFQERFGDYDSKLRRSIAPSTA
jgi:hypothetical protein